MDPSNPNLPDHLRAFDDTDTARKWIYETALEGVTKRFPVEDEEYRLDLKDPHYEGNQEYTLEEQKRALIKRRRLYTPLRGTWELTHKPTGQLLDQRFDTVMQVPFLTNRGTFIQGGSEYSGVNQQRLKPGIYSRITNAGLPEAFFNPDKRTGKPFRIEMEPETGVFKLNVKQASIPLYPLLKSLGYDDKAMAAMWGPHVAAANAGTRHLDAFDKLHAQFIGKFGKATDSMGKRQEVLDGLMQYKVDPDVVTRTLGVTSPTLTPAMFAEATKKLLRISKGEEEPDDRDAPINSNLLSYEDFIRERIDNDAGKLTRQLFWKLKRDKTLKRLPFAALNPYISDYINGSRLTMPLEETNPLHTYDQMHRIVRTGEGGIGDIKAVTMSARDVNPGQLGFIDGVAGPEGLGIGVDVRATYKSFKGKDRQIYGEFMDTKTGRMSYLKPEDMHGKTLEFPSQDPKSPTVRAMQNGRIVEVPRADVDYRVPTMAHMYGFGANSTPMPTSMMPARLFYASKYWPQFMPLVKGETPLIDTLMPDQSDVTALEHYGRAVGTIRARAAGTVSKVTPDGVTVKADSGETHEYPAVKNFPFNRLTAISYTPNVNVGDTVAAGGMVAHSNFTDAKTGSLNMGVNLRTAIIPAKGSSFEDAAVISRSAAQRLATDRLFSHELEARNGVEIDRNKFVSLFPDAFTKEQMEKLDDRGIVKAGTVVNPGDVLTVGIGPKILSPEEVKLGKLHKALRSTFTNKAITWDHDYPGEVTDAEMAGNTAVVNVRAAVPLEIGDKVTTSQAMKGVVSRIVDDENMPRNAATNEPYELLFNPLNVLSRVSPNQVALIRVAKVAKQLGQQLRIPQEAPKEGWNKWAINLLQQHNVPIDSDIFDPESGKTVKGIRDGYAYVSPFHHLAEKKISDRGSTGGYTCYDRHTEVLTDQGWLAWPDVPAGAKFATVSDGEFIYVEASERIKKRYSGTLLGGLGKHINYLVTPNHRMYVSSTKRPDRYDFIPAETLHTCRGFNVKTVIPGVFKGKNAPTIELAGMQVPAVPYAQLAGWYIAEGSCSISPRSRSYKVQIWQCEASNPVKFAMIAQLLRLLPFSFCIIHRGKQAVGFSLNGRELVAHMGEHYGRGSASKRIGRMLLSASSDVRRALFDVLIAGDGDWQLDAQSCHMRYATTSKQLANDVAELALKNGYASVTYSYSAALLPSTEYTRLPYHVVSFSLINKSATFTLKRRYTCRFIEVPYRGYVYCATVPTGLLFVRRDGKAMLCGNSNMQPSHGGQLGGGAKKFGFLDLNAALGHGATEVIRDVINVRGNKNEDYWKALKLGRPLPEPTVPFVYDKFMNLIKAGGINIRSKGDTMSLMPMTDDEVGAMSHGAIEKSDMVDRNFDPTDKGLFDVGRTGGLGGNQWTHIDLHEPVPNPAFEEPVRRMLGLTQKKLEGVVAGTETLDGKASGGNALKEALSKLDIDAEIVKQKAGVMNLRGASRDNAVKLIGYYEGLKKQGVHPGQLMISKVPVLPPIFRPMAQMGSTTLQSDINELYRDILETNGHVTQLKSELGEKGPAEERVTLYNAVKAAYGLGNPITAEGAAKGLKGAIRQVIGVTPKYSLFQSKVISKPVDAVGRSVITPDPSYDMDTVGIPEPAAWSLYAPYIMRRLVQRGYPAERVSQMIEEHHPDAHKMMEEEMRERPVIIDRAPVWHKFNLMAFWPQLVKEKTMRISPLIVSGFNADFDGDRQLNSVLTLITKTARLCIDRKEGKRFLEARRMPFNSTLTVPVKRNAELYLIDLADFPHGTLLRKSGGKTRHIDFYAGLSGVKVLGLCERTGTARWAPVAGWSEHRGCATEIVNLGQNEQIYTDDDPRAVFGIANDEFKLVRARPLDALTRKFMVPKICRGTNTFGGDLTQMGLGGVRSNNHNVRAHCKPVIELNADTGYVLGVLAGDGWASVRKQGGSNQVCVAGTSTELFDKFDHCLPAFFEGGITPEGGMHTAEKSAGRYGACSRVAYASVELSEVVGRLLGRGAKNKQLPAFYLSACREFRLGLFAGLMDTDGTICVVQAKSKKPQLQASFTSTSFRLVREFRLLAMSLGIRASISVFTYRGSRDAWIVSLSSLDVYAWRGRHMVVAQKLAALATASVPNVDAAACAAHDLVPFPCSVAEAVSAWLNQHGYARRGASREQKTMYMICRNGRLNNRISRLSACRFVALGMHLAARDSAAWAAAVANLDITWLPVLSVEKTGRVELGYDLTVPGCENFMTATGLVVSNTMNFHVPSSPKAVSQAIEKMMPSKNLISLTDYHSPRHPVSKEFLIGLHSLTRAPAKKPVQKFKSVEDAEKAYRRGQLAANDPIEIVS